MSTKCLEGMISGLTLLFWASHSPLWAQDRSETIRTRDDLSLVLSPEGRVTDCRIGEVRLPLTAPGGFLVADYAANPQKVNQVPHPGFEPVTGTLRREGDSLQFRADLPDMQLRQRATYTPKDGLIQVDGEIEDTSGRDRAIGVAFRLPFDAQGWVWSDDIEERRTISDPDLYERTYRCESGEGRCSIYPFAALSSDRAGLSLALPLSQGPRVFLLGYDNGDKFAFLNFYLGLSKETAHFPQRASFHLVIYRHDPKWALRSTAARYYQFFPESFQKRAGYEGYLNYVDLEQVDRKTRRLTNGDAEVEDASDFGEGFRYLTHLHGCYHYQMYFTDDSRMPEDAKVRAFLSTLVEQERTQPRYYCPTAELLKKITLDAEGRIRYIPDTEYRRSGDRPGWGLNFHVNEDPGVSDHIANRHRQVLEEWRGYPEWQPWEACVTADAIAGYGENTRGLNYRREHFRTVTFPLTFGQASRKVAISNGIWEFHRQVWWPLTEKHKVLTVGNTNTYEMSFTLPFVDLPMIETNFDRENPARCERFLRTLGHHKVFRSCYVARPGVVHREGAVAQFHQGLAYVIFPSVYALFGELDRYRGEYRKYVPALEHLAAAGWEPIPHARTSDPAIPVERFGSFAASTLHFTLRNYGAEAKRVRITFEPEGLGVPADQVGALMAKDLLTRLPVHLTRTPTEVAADVTVPPDDSLGLRVDTPNGFARYALRQADAGFRRIERMFRPDLTEENRAELARGQQVAAEALRSFEATQGRRQAGAAVESLQELLRALEPALATGAPVDRAKVFFRLKTELAEGAAALLGVEVGLARDAEGVAGQRTALRLSLNHRGDTALEDIRVSVLSPWPARAGQSAVSGAPTRLEPGASADCEVALPVPEVPARSLLPFVVEVRGQAAGSPFTLAALVDVTVQPALTAGLDVGRLRVGSSRPVPVWLTNRTGGAAQGTIALEVPAEWRIEPALQKFEIPAGATRPIRFVVSLSKNAPTGPASLRADIRTVAPETQRLQPLSLSVGEAAPRIVVRRVAEPPALDGALTEVVWRGPPSIPELIHFRLDQPASEKTAVWLTYDERGLYVAFRCQESNMNAIKATLTERGSPLYEDDDVELFIAAPGRAALQFAINSLGTQSDNFGNNTPWRAAARRGEDEWSVEVFIPFAGLGLEGPPIPSDVWDMQIGRQEKRLGERTAWTRCPDGFRTEAHFGEVEFGE